MIKLPKIPKRVGQIVIWNFYSPRSFFGSCMWNLAGLMHIEPGKALQLMFKWAITSPLED